MQYNGGAGIGVPLETYLGVLKDYNDLKIEYDRLKNASPTPLQMFATPDNINKALEIAGMFASSLTNKNKPAQLLAAPDQFDKDTSEAVNTLLTFEDGRQAIINIAAAGPLVWAMIQQGLKDNKLLP
jgi:hypothetical protein